MKILFAASEASPFIVSGGLGEVTGALSQALADMKFEEENDIRVILPLYSNISQKFREKMTFLGSKNVQLAWRNQYCGIFYYPVGRVKYYFIDNKYYFDRYNTYGEYDDGERFAFFSKAVLETMRMIDFYPDVIHCHDWQTGLIPVYLKLYYRFIPEYSRMKALFTIHNIQYQGIFDLRLMYDVFDISAGGAALVEHKNCINLMKGGIICSDYVTTVSPSYSEEIKNEYYSHGLEWIIQEKSNRLTGILNGIDTKSYDPVEDKMIAENYSFTDLSGKITCKRELQKEMGLPVREDIPVIAMVSRLVGHKGIDLINYIMNELMWRDIQFVVVGTGNKGYEEDMRWFSRKYSGKFSTRIEFSNELSRRVYSGADMFLMPSKSEPCGLAQMIALRYGTIPIVRETGGLKDTIMDYGIFDNSGIGFTFKTYNAHDMLGAIDRALGLYHNNKKLWKELVVRALRQDFSWKKSSIEYMKLYKNM